MAASERLFACTLAALLGGCSLIFDASDHQDGPGEDAGPDASMADAGDGEDMQVAEDMGLPEDDMGTPDLGVEGCGVAELTGGSLVADGAEAYDVDSFTLEVWYRPNAASLIDNHNVFGRWGRFGSTGSYALYLANGRPSLAISCDGTDFNPVTASSAITVDTWVHLAATFDSSDGRARVFIDGSVDGNTTIDCDPASGAGRPFPLGTEADLVLGYDDPAGGNPAEGLIDEARLSSVVRYEGDSFPVPDTFTSDADPDTVALYQFEDDALPATDASVNENDMSAEGSARLTTACRP